MKYDSKQKTAENPMIGIRKQELNGNYFREWFYRDYSLIYEIVGHVLLIHKVHDHKRYFIRSTNRK